MDNIKIINRKAKPLNREKDDGYIEYKWKLTNIEKNKLIRLSSQMNYRLNEGCGKSLYAIGFLDDGSSIGISDFEMSITLDIIKDISCNIGANIMKILMFNEKNMYWAKIFIFKKNINKTFL